MPPRFLAAALFLTAATLSHAADIYVSTTGNNSNPGTQAAPLRSITSAIATANPGDNVIVRGGVYNGRLTPSKSGTAANRLTVKNFPSETPILDGTGVAVGGQTALIDIGNRSHLTIQGFEIRNLTTNNNDSTPLGILIDGASVGIQILDCEIHAIRNDGDNGNAHGILVRGNTTTAISDLIISGNEIRNLILGNSEALVLNGNVNGFEVSNNYVHDCNNLGIDFIGFEGTGPAGLDQARNGICRDNTVTDITTINNPAYNAYSAGGIYVDGGRDIIIERNQVARCDIGIEIASEAAGRTTSNITARNNIIWNNYLGGIFVGGYEAARGAATNCNITGNTLYRNDTGRNYSGEILVQFNTSNLDITNNIIVADSQKDFVIINNGNNSNITLDYNLYYSSSATNSNGSEWIWNGVFRSGFNSWRSISGQDSNSIYANPQLSPTTFTIASNSPARDSGDPAYVPATGETDAFGEPRISGTGIDIGAHEYISLTPLQQWREFHFNTTANSGNSANLADPDEDGLPNLLEFALLGQSPIAPETTSPITITTPGLTFRENPEATGEVIFQIQGSSDLSSWIILASRPQNGTWSTSPSTTISTSEGNTTFSDSRTLPSGEYFYRLRIVAP